MKYFKDLLLGLAVAFLLLFFNSFSSSAAPYDGYTNIIYYKSAPYNRYYVYAFTPLNNSLKFFAYGDSQYAGYLGVYDGSNLYRVENMSLFSSSFTGQGNELDNFYFSQYDVAPSSNTYHPNSEIVVSTIPVFQSFSSAQNYYLNGIIDEDANVPSSPINDLDSVSGDLPTPLISWNSSGKLSFLNAQDNVNVIVYGRWRSIDDIELVKESGFADLGYFGLDWSFHAHSTVQSDLVPFISSSDNVPSSSVLNFLLLDSTIENFNTLNSKYPIESRNIYGGFASNGNSLSGRDNYITKLKQSLGFPGGYNQPEFFARYYQITDNGVLFSPWGHLVSVIPDATISADDIINNTDKRFFNDYGVNTVPIPDINNLVNGVVDNVTDSVVFPNINWGNTINGNNNPIINNNGTDYDLDFKPSLSTFLQLKSMFGVFPTIVQDVFVWMPSWLLQLICLSITLMVALGVYHAIRG